MISSIHKSSINSQLIGLNSIRDNSMRDQCDVVNSPVLPSFNRGDLVSEIREKILFRANEFGFK